MGKKAKRKEQESRAKALVSLLSEKQKVVLMFFAWLMGYSPD